MPGVAGDGIADRGGDVELEAADRERLVDRMGDGARRRSAAVAGAARRSARRRTRRRRSGRARRPAGSDRGDARGERLDQFVAAVVADRIVDRLEAVDVEIDDRELARARRPSGSRGDSTSSLKPVRFIRPVMLSVRAAVTASCSLSVSAIAILRARKAAPKRDDAEQRQRDRDGGATRLQHRVAGVGGVQTKAPIGLPSRSRDRRETAGSDILGRPPTCEMQVVDQERRAEIVQPLARRDRCPNEERQRRRLDLVGARHRRHAGRPPSAGCRRRRGNSLPAPPRWRPACRRAARGCLSRIAA